MYTWVERERYKGVGMQRDAESRERCRKRMDQALFVLGPTTKPNSFFGGTDGGYSFGPTEQVE